MNNTLIKLVLCTVAASALALTSHILISAWAGPQLAELTQGITGSMGEYSQQIKLAAYATALIPVGLATVVYYYAGHLLEISNRLIKVLFVAVIMLELKGALLRQPLMDYAVNVSMEGMHHPAAFVFLSNVDIWIANILLAFCLVYFCPVKKQQAASGG